MLYVIAMIGNDGVRLFNTDVREYKDMKLNMIEYLLKNNMEIKNVSNLLPNGNFNILGGRSNYAKFDYNRYGEKVLVTTNIPTVITHTDAGKTTIVDAHGVVSERYTSSLRGYKLSNASFTPDGRLEGFFDKISYKEFAGEMAESLSLFGDDYADGAKLDFQGEEVEWSYTGEKKVQSIIIPDGVTKIKPGALNGVNTSLLELPTTLTQLRRGDLQGVFAQKIFIPAGKLKSLDNQAFYDTKIGILHLCGVLAVHPLAFYGSRISKILAQGATYKSCMLHKPSGTTQVKILKA